MDEADSPYAVELPDFQEMSDASATQMVKLLWQNFKIKQAMDLLSLVWKKITTAAIRHGWPLLLPVLKLQQNRQTAELLRQETGVRAAVCEADILVFIDQNKEQTMEVMGEDKDINQGGAETEAPPSKEPSTKDFADVLSLSADCNERLESSVFDTQEALLHLQKVKIVVGEKYHTRIPEPQQSQLSCVLRRQNDRCETARQAINHTEFDVGDMTVELLPMKEVDFEGFDKTAKEALRTRKEAKDHGNDDEGKGGFRVYDGLVFIME